MRQRYCKATIYDDKTKQTKSFENLAMTFNILSMANTSFAKGTFAIAGLSSETIEQYTMFIPNFLTDGYYKCLKIEAGYIEYGVIRSTTIFDGFIRQALPTALPDRWLVCDVIETLNTSFNNQILNYTDINLYNLVAEIAINFGIAESQVDKRVVDLTKTAKNVIVKKYTQYGNLQQHLNKLTQMFYRADGYRIWLDKGVFYIGDYAGIRDKQSTLKIGGKDGLLIYGVVQPDVAGVNVKTELVDNLNLFNNFSLESKLIPSANGTYTALSLNYVGETRGTNWYCDVRGINPDREIDRMYANG